MKRIFLFSFFTILSLTLNAGSILSSNGIGQPYPITDAATAARGGISFGIRDPTAADACDPRGGQEGLG